MFRNRISHFEKKCRKRGLALTVQRRAILQELLTRQDHPTADQLYEAVRERVPGLSRTTVYRVLETLVRVGAARKVCHHDSVVRFDPNVGRHHHLVCESCGALLDLEDSAIRSLGLPDTRHLGFTIKDYSINFTGICQRCRPLS